MNSYEEILDSLLVIEGFQAILPKVITEKAKSSEVAYNKALEIIKALIEDKSLSNKDCFLQIEKIIVITKEWATMLAGMSLNGNSNQRFTMSNGN